MTRYPFGQTLLDVSTVSAIFWAVALIRVEYVGPVAVFIAASCGVLWLVVKIRRAFEFASRDLVDFVAGRGRPLVNVQPRTATGQFASKREIIHAALRRDVGAK